MTNKINPLPIPAIHSNGSGVKNLTSNAMAVYEGLETTLAAMRLNRPHGRDYYTISDSALKDAQEAHSALETQIQAIADVYKDFILTVKYGES